MTSTLLILEAFVKNVIIRKQILLDNAHRCHSRIEYMWYLNYKNSIDINIIGNGIMTLYIHVLEAFPLLHAGVVVDKQLRRHATPRDGEP